MKILLLSLFVVAVAAAPRFVDDQLDIPKLEHLPPPDLFQPEIPYEPIELPEPHPDAQVVSPSPIYPAPAEPDAVPDPVVLPGPANPEVVPGPVVLPGPAKPEVVPDPIVLPGPANPEVVPGPVVLPEPAIPEVVPGPVILPQPILPAPEPEVEPEPIIIVEEPIVVDEPIIVEEPIISEEPEPVPQIPTGEIYNDGLVQVTVNAPEEAGYLSTLQSWFSMILNYFNNGVQTSQQIV